MGHTGWRWGEPVPHPGRIVISGWPIQGEPETVAPPCPAPSLSRDACRAIPRCRFAPSGRGERERLDKRLAIRTTTQGAGRCRHQGGEETPCTQAQRTRNECCRLREHASDPAAKAAGRLLPGPDNASGRHAPCNIRKIPGRHSGSPEWPRPGQCDERLHFPCGAGAEDIPPASPSP